MVVPGPVPAAAGMPRREAASVEGWAGGCETPSRTQKEAGSPVGCTPHFP